MLLFIRNLSKDERQVLRSMHDKNSTEERMKVLESQPEMFKKFAKVATKTMVESHKGLDKVSQAFISEVTEFFIEVDLLQIDDLETPKGRIIDGRLARLVKKWNVLTEKQKATVDLALSVRGYFEGLFCIV
ncbi:unnamed protein product [Bursaphelenchus okinawaensis]|uniref:Uncharacterized protein n=1 Tax=Bursaphelenchus okinawaensis TaxID=465554 RepID=A0A811L723_9BILA|nr:unnamed protein product [Bursaphelenchus okinawaensis]CAG9117956.1 unnamed protein product [Bursaphelenchus okinawaensis]